MSTTSSLSRSRILATSNFTRWAHRLQPLARALTNTITHTIQLYHQHHSLTKDIILSFFIFSCKSFQQILWFPFEIINFFFLTRRFVNTVWLNAVAAISPATDCWAYMVNEHTLLQPGKMFWFFISPFSTIKALHRHYRYTVEVEDDDDRYNSGGEKETQKGWWAQMEWG